MALGCIRADGLDERMIGGPPDQGGDATFYLICGADSASLDPGALGIFDAPLELAALPGVPANIIGASWPVNVTTLFSALADCAAPTGVWGGDATPRLMPQPGEERQAWAARVAAPTLFLARLTERWDVAGRNVELFASYGVLALREEAPRKFVGIWPCGHVSLVVGDDGSGKSTAMHEWVAAADGAELGRPRQVWGCNLTGRFIAALIFAEDTEEDITARGKRFVPLWGDPWFFSKDATGMKIDQIIALLDQAPVLDLVVLDPFRMFMEGNEDSSEAVSAFYNSLLTFARRKKCAIVVVHHMAKGSRRALHHMKAAIRGSGVHAQRARLVIGMTDKSGAVQIGVIKLNGLPGDPAVTVLGPKDEGRLFRRDEETLTLLPVNALSPAMIATDDTNDRVLAALTWLLATGEQVFPTGRKSLHARQVPELAGVSRPKIEASIQELMAAGHVTQDKDAGLGLAVKILP